MIACQSQVRRAGLAGTPVGLDLAVVLEVAATMGLERDVAVELVPAIEAGMLAGLAERQRDDGDHPVAGRAPAIRARPDGAS